MAGEWGRQSLPMAVGQPRGVDTSESTARLKIPSGRACTGWMSAPGHKPRALGTSCSSPAASQAQTSLISSSGCVLWVSTRPWCTLCVPAFRSPLCSSSASLAGVGHLLHPRLSQMHLLTCHLPKGHPSPFTRCHVQDLSTLQPHLLPVWSPQRIVWVGKGL